MLAIPYVKKRIGRTYLVCVQNSNQYIQLEEPAWFVFSKTAKRYKTETIAKVFAIRYGIGYEESHIFVKDIRSQIKMFNQSENSAQTIELASEDLKKYKFSPFSRHFYQLGNHLIAFTYETRLFEHYLHPLIAHFETKEVNGEVPLFELFEWHEKIVFRFNGEVKGIWTKDESHLVKGLIFLFLINVMYNKPDADWLMTVHASAVTNGKKTILFSAEPGKGKTTMAALLQSHGYQIISDDFVPIARIDFCAYPFPIAMSVKQGSMDLLSSLFPELEQKDLTFISPEKSVRYLPIDQIDVFQSVFPVREFIFLSYDESVDFIMETLDPVNAAKMLFSQSWVSPNQGNAAILFDRLLQTSFYRLTYSDNQKALNAITNLFDHD